MLHLHWPRSFLRKMDAQAARAVRREPSSRHDMRRTTLSTDRLTVHIGIHEVLGVYALAGDELSCLDGLLWVTQEGSAEDQTLPRGSRLRVTHPGLALVQAIDAGTVAITVDARPGER